MIFPPDGYRPHIAFIAAARPRSELWRTFLGALLIGALYLAASFALIAFLRARYSDPIATAILIEMVRGQTPGMMILLLFSFLGLALAPLAVARALHGRRAGTLFGPWLTVRSDFTRVFGACLLLNLLFLPLNIPADAEPGLGPGRLLLFLPVAFIGILIQTGAEELVFRGYLQQQLAARVRSPWVWMILPSALFSWGHYMPEAYGANALTISLWAGLFGCLTADLTARTGSLGAAIGFHAANNVVAFLLVGVQGDMDGLALWTRPLDLADPQTMRPLLLLDMAMMIVSWLAARLALRV